MVAAHPIAALRPFPVSDLIARRVAWRGTSSWVLHNPISGRYARIHPRLYALLGQLDGQRSVDEAMAALPPPRRRSRMRRSSRAASRGCCAWGCCASRAGRRRRHPRSRPCGG